MEDMDTLDLHVCGITDDGKLWHTSRSVQSSHVVWSPWEEVKATGMSSLHHFVKVASVSTRREKDGSSTDKEFHVLAITDDGKLLHTSRLVQQNWQPFEDLGTTLANAGPFRSVAGNEFRGTLDICAIVSVEHGDQRILHTIRSSTGWEQFEEITQSQLAGFPGSFTSADCARNFMAFLFTGLHVCGLTHDGKLWYTLNFQQPTWLPFAQIPSKNAPNAFTDVSVALAGGGLHICSQAEGTIWHTMRFLDPPKWQDTFDNVKEQAASNPGIFVSASCANLAGDLHICGLTEDGKLWHTFLSSSVPAPGWQPVWHAFEDVTALAGSPGHFTFISVTGDPNAWGPIGGGGDPTCNVINTCIANDNLQIQTLQAQEASTTNSARIAQINQQIAGLRQDIASLQQQRREHHCP
jgi:hypothetical protein